MRRMMAKSPASTGRGLTGHNVIRMVADAVMVNVALVAAIGARFVLLGWSETGSVDPLRELVQQSVRVYATGALALTPLCLASFALHGFYTYGRAYTGRRRHLVLISAVTLPYLGFGAGMYLLFNLTSWFPRSVWLIGWLLSIALISALRVGSRMWREAAWAEARIWGRPPRRTVNNVLVIGGAGYLGSVLVRRLLERSYQVTVMDALMFGDGSVRELMTSPGFELIKGDLRNVDAVVRAMEYADCVVHLGAIVGDPASDVDSRLTEEVNLAATRMVVEVAKGFGIQHFVFASTCSVYGAGKDLLDESSALDPVSLYSRSKMECERVLLELEDELFAPTILRFATFFGLSPRPRFDLAVNTLAAKAVTEGQISIYGGDQWRPFIHVFDAADAIVSCIEAPIPAVKGEVFNVGSDAQNLRLRELGELIVRFVPGTKMELSPARDQGASYRVSFEKLRSRVGFEPRLTLADGIMEIKGAIDSGVIDYRAAIHSNERTLSLAASELSAVRSSMGLFSEGGGRLQQGERNRS